MTMEKDIVNAKETPVTTNNEGNEDDIVPLELVDEGEIKIPR